MTRMFVWGVLSIGMTITVLLLFWKFWFLRDPKRYTPSGDNLIVSPADGKVVKVASYNAQENTFTNITKGTFGKIRTRLSEISDKGYIISIFMSPLNVHINRTPIAGTIVSQVHTSGRFHSAYLVERALIENEKNEIIVENNNMRIKIIQIAGAIARRIQSFVHEGNVLTSGQKIGLINLGSQCTVILPQDFVTVLVREGDRVRAGESVIASFQK